MMSAGIATTAIAPLYQASPFHHQSLEEQHNTQIHGCRSGEVISGGQ